MGVATFNGGTAYAAAVKSAAVRPHVDPNATITNISITFVTHDDNKDFDTAVSVVVQEKFSFFNQNLASLTNFAGSTEFGDNPPSTHTFNLPLASQNVTLSSLTNAPTYSITINPNGHDTWIFDVTVTITTSDGSQFVSPLATARLTQDQRTFNGSF
jgi:hypothetical protein